MSRCLVMSVKRFGGILNKMCDSTHLCKRAISIEEKGKAEENVYFLKQQQHQILYLRKKLMDKESNTIEALLAIDKKLDEMENLKKAYIRENNKISLELVKAEIARLKAVKLSTLKTLSTFENEESKSNTWMESFQELDKQISQKEKQLNDDANQTK